MSSTRGLSGVSKGDITELKSLAAPPQSVKHVLSAVWLLLGNPPANNNFNSHKKMLADGGFLEVLVPDKISAKALEDAQKELELAGSLEKVKNCSAACASFFMWATKRVNEVKTA